jgi:hypothetical protein
MQEIPWRIYESPPTEFTSCIGKRFSNSKNGVRTEVLSLECRVDFILVSKQESNNIPVAEPLFKFRILTGHFAGQELVMSVYIFFAIFTEDP